MKHKKNLFLCLIAILAIFSIVSCSENELPPVPGEGDADQIQVSENLDAYRAATEANSAMENGADATINIQVTGTVTTYFKGKTSKGDDKWNTYLTDEKGDALFIYGDVGQELKAGDKVTLKATLLQKYQDGFQLPAANVTIINVENGTPIAPTKLTTQESFLELGSGIQLNYVSFLGRVISTGKNNQVNLLAEMPTDLSTLKNPDSIVIDENLVVDVRPQKDMDLIRGSIYLFEGQMARYTSGDNTTVQLMCFNSSEKWAMPAVKPIETTFEDYQAAATANLASASKYDFPAPLLIKGVVTNATPSGMGLLAYDKNGKYSSETAIEYQGTVPEGITTGSIVTVKTNNIEKKDNMAFCSNFEVTDSSKKEPVENILNAANATFTKHVKDNTDADNIWNAINNKGRGCINTRDFIKARGIFDRLQVNSKDKTKVYGFYINLENGGSIYVVSGKDPGFKKNDIIEAYGLLGTNEEKETSRIIQPTYEKVDTYIPPKPFENSIPKAMSSYKGTTELDMSPLTTFIDAHSTDDEFANFIKSGKHDIGSNNKQKYDWTLKDEEAIVVTGIVSYMDDKQIILTTNDGAICLRDYNKGENLEITIGDVVTATSTKLASFKGNLQLKYADLTWKETLKDESNPTKLLSYYNPLTTSTTVSPKDSNFCHIEAKITEITESNITISYNENNYTVDCYNIKEDLKNYAVNDTIKLSAYVSFDAKMNRVLRVFDSCMITK